MHDCPPGRLKAEEIKCQWREAVWWKEKAFLAYSFLHFLEFSRLFLLWRHVWSSLWLKTHWNSDLGIPFPFFLIFLPSWSGSVLEHIEHKPSEVLGNTQNLMWSQSLSGWVTEFGQAGIDHGAWDMQVFFEFVAEPHLRLIHVWGIYLLTLLRLQGFWCLS